MLHVHTSFDDLGLILRLTDLSERLNKLLAAFLGTFVFDVLTLIGCRMDTVGT